MKIIYKSEDGKEFDSKTECIKYEVLLLKARKLADDKHFYDMTESSYAESLLELHAEGKITIN